MNIIINSRGFIKNNIIQYKYLHIFSILPHVHYIEIIYKLCRNFFSQNSSPNLEISKSEIVVVGMGTFSLSQIYHTKTDRRSSNWC